jgi:FecR protein
MEKTKNLLLKSLFTVFIGLVMSQVAYAKSAGTVTFATGDASIVRADKSVVKAAKNDAINAGDTIETRTGRLQLSLVDGGKVSLQPNTIYKINKYEFSGKEDGSEYAFTELVKGGLRTISGLIGHKNRDRFQLKTAVATIGIRGTEFTVNFNDNQLLMTTNHGSVDVCNAGGCLNAISGQSIAVNGVGASPKPSDKAAKAAAAAPAASNKVAFATSDTITDAGLPSVIAQAILPPAPEVIVPPQADDLANYNGPGNLLSVMKTVNGDGFDGATLANIQTSANSAPKNLTANPNGLIEILPSSFSSINSDGIIGWGRYSGTIVSSPGGVVDRLDTIEWADYAIGKTPNATELADLAGTYYVFGSTAPMSIDASGSSFEIGSENAVTGDLKFSFATRDFAYNLNIPTAFNVNYAISGFGNLIVGKSTFNSSDAQSIVTGGGCNSGACSAALQGGNVMQGAFFGTKGERAGLQYGFNLPGNGISGGGGQIFGTTVLKSTPGNISAVLE